MVVGDSEHGRGINLNQGAQRDIKHVLSQDLDQEHGRIIIILTDVIDHADPNHDYCI